MYLEGSCKDIYKFIKTDKSSPGYKVIGENSIDIVPYVFGTNVDTNDDTNEYTTRYYSHIYRN